MPAQRKYKTLVGDFETTVYRGQTSTEVWASALVEIGTEDVSIFHSIEDTYNYLLSLKSNCIIYYHNLKFDGAFWLDFLLRKGYTQAFNDIAEFVTRKMNGEPVGDLQPEATHVKHMENKSLAYTISDMGQWYRIIFKYNNRIYELRDSLKLLPFSVKEIGKAFKTKHQKLEMEYEGFRYAGCKITDEEKVYISNDVLVVKEALEIMFSQGHDALTIGACCLKEFKSFFDKDTYEEYFPDCYEMPLDPNIYGSSNVDAYIRKAYGGGWCYLREEKANRIFHNGLTADANSLYPSQMHSDSGNKYPIGKPTFWHGNFIPNEAIADDKLFFIRIRTRFYLKPGYLPCIQVKRNLLYRSTEWLRTSDIKKDDTYYRYILNDKGEPEPTTVTLTLTMMDYYLIKEHYFLEDFEILDGCWFYAVQGLFDPYINKYREIKENSTGAIRTLAKLFLNNLYGKLAASTDSSHKLAIIDPETDALSYVTVISNEKQPGYIPIGCCVTSYARNTTISIAQANFHGDNEPGFIYADTDSIHCDCAESELIDVPVHPTKFCYWKVESHWDEAIFARQKTYIERVIATDDGPVDPRYNIVCAGMPKSCKDLLNLSMTTQKPDDDPITKKPRKYNDVAMKFLSKKRTLADFKVGLTVPGKLLPKRMHGGVVLSETTFQLL